MKGVKMGDRSTRIVSFRISYDDYYEICYEAESKNISISDYLRSLTKSELKKLRRKPTDGSDDATYQIALAIATVLQIANQQSLEARIAITETAQPILQKLN